MKHPIILFIVLILIAENITAQNYGLGNTDPSVFSKYRVPETNLSSLRFDTYFQFHNNENEQNNLFTEHTINDTRTDIAYSLAPQYYLLKERDDRLISLNVNLQGSYYYTFEKRTEDYTTSRKTTSDALRIDVNGTYNNYFNPDKLFYSASSNIVVDTRESRMEGLYDSYKRQRYDLSIGIGWGRIRNVTPVVSAIRFQERLKQMNLLKNDLSEKTIGDLAEQFSKSIYYYSVHDRADKYFWQDIEKVLSNDGVSLNGINQYGSSYLREAPYENRFIRNEGFISGINLKLNYINNYSSGYPAESRITEQFDIQGNAYLGFSHQLNLVSQIHGSLSLSGGPNVIEKSHIKQRYDVNAIMGYDYELTDRLVTSIYNVFDLSFVNFGGQDKFITNELNLSVFYFVEDNYSLNATYKWDYELSKYSNTEKRTSSSNHIQIGFTYYIGRGFLYN